MSMNLPGHSEIVNVAANTGQKSEILEPADRAPAIVGLHASLFPCRSGQRRGAKRNFDCKGGRAMVFRIGEVIAAWFWDADMPLRKMFIAIEMAQSQYILKDTDLHRIMAKLCGWAGAQFVLLQSGLSYHHGMTKLLEQAFEAVHRLPADPQDDIARTILHVAGSEVEAEAVD